MPLIALVRMSWAGPGLSFFTLSSSESLTEEGSSPTIEMSAMSAGKRASTA